MTATWSKNATRRILAMCMSATLVAAACVSNATTPSTSSTSESLTGRFTGRIIVTATAGTTVCVSTRTVTGTLRVTPRISTADVTGTADARATLVEIAVAPPTCPALTQTLSFERSISLSGTATDFTLSASRTQVTPGVSGTVNCTDTVAFAGVFDGADATGQTITGTLTFTTTCVGGNGLSPFTSGGVATMPITLRR